MKVDKNMQIHMLVIKNITKNTIYTTQELHTFSSTFNGIAFSGIALNGIIYKVPFS